MPRMATVQKTTLGNAATSLVDLARRLSTPTGTSVSHIRSANVAPSSCFPRQSRTNLTTLACIPRPFQTSLLGSARLFALIRCLDSHTEFRRASRSLLRSNVLPSEASLSHDDRT